MTKFTSDLKAVNVQAGLETVQIRRSAISKSHKLPDVAKAKLEGLKNLSVQNHFFTQAKSSDEVKK